MVKNLTGRNRPVS